METENMTKTVGGAMVQQRQEDQEMANRPAARIFRAIPDFTDRSWENSIYEYYVYDPYWKLRDRRLRIAPAGSITTR